MADRMQQLSSLLDNPDPKVRLYALDELIRNAHRMTEGELAAVLEKTSGDDDRDVSSRATEGLTIMEQRGFKQLRRARNRRANLAPLAPHGQESVPVREAGYSVLDGVLHALVSLAGEMSSARANAAMEALGAIRYPQSLGPLLKCLAKKATAQAAARAISRYPEQASLPVLRKALGSEAFKGQIAVIVSALGELDGEESFELLREHAEDDDARVREAVALALGGRSEHDAETLLIDLVRDEAAPVVQAAVTSLGLVGEGKAADQLHSLFIDTDDSRTQAAILSALALIHRHESVEVIAKGLRSTDGRVRANAVEALACYDLRPPEALRHFEPALRDDNNRASANAILALYPYDKERSVAILRRMLKHQDALKRSSAAYIIGEIQDPSLMHGLITMINTEQDKNVLSSALSSIERLRNPEMKVSISKLCQHPNDLIRGRAIQIFAAMSGVSEIRALETYYTKETSPTVSATIVAAFGAVCDMNHLSFLRARLRDQDDRIVANAVEALDRVGALENADLVQPLTNHHSPRVRSNALLALWHQGHLPAADKLAEMLESTDDDTLQSALHTACDFGRALSPLGLRSHPLLRSALQSAFERMSSIGMTSWDLFRSTQFYRDVISAGPEEEPSAEELAAAPEVEEVEVPEEPEEVPVAELAGSDEPPEAIADPGEPALIAGLGALAGGNPEKAAGFFGRDVEATDSLGMLRYLARLTAREAGDALPSSPLREDSDAIPFVPLHTAKIEAARADNDLSASLMGYFSLYRAQLALLAEVVEVGERVLGDGNEASAARIAKDLAQYLKGDAGIHRTLGDLHFGVRDYPAAYDQLLRAWAHEPAEPELILRLASVAARVGKKKIARAMVRILLEKVQVEGPMRIKAEGLARILDSRPS